MFTLLHTNDFHNTFTAEQAMRLQQRRAALGVDGLLLDAGDAVRSGNITYRSAEPILDLMNKVGYDAMTVGNREFHFSRHGFQATLARARFPILCANVRRTGFRLREERSLASHAASGITGEERIDPPVCPFMVIEKNPRWRVVVFGVTVPMITEQMLVRKMSAYVFDDPLEIAVTMAQRLKQQFRPDLLIALTHIGLPQDRRLAECAPEIDLIVGGHTHDLLTEGEWRGETLIVQAGSHGKCYGVVQAERGTSGCLTLGASVETL